jgi:hypothetical protein
MKEYKIPKAILSVSKLETAIKKAKEMLDKRARKEGVYENFGVNEANAIEEKFITLGDFSDTMLRRRTQITHFREWCAEYSLEC